MKKKRLPLTNIVGRVAVNGILKIVLLQCLCVVEKIIGIFKLSETLA